MRYLFYTCGDRNKASSRVRAYWIADVLRARGNKCFIESAHSYLALVMFLLRMPFYDVLIFQKSYSRWHCLLLRFAKLLNKKTILDLDDAPSRTNNPVTLKNVEFMMSRVSAVTVGSQFLFEYASKFAKQVRIIPSGIYLKHYSPQETQKSNDVPVCLGWIGNGSHYQEDLVAILTEPLAEIAKDKHLRFKVIGACGEKRLYDSFSGIDGLTTDFIDQVDWSNPHAVATALSDVDIGLYPLLPNDSNRYKCGFKALEYMAMRIPVVSSRVAENKLIIVDGENGFFADGCDEWVAALNTLIGDFDLRKQMGDAGRNLVEEKYSVENSASLLEKLVVEREDNK